jgi:hypothetical protein
LRCIYNTLMTASYLAITLSQALLAMMQIYIASGGSGIAPRYFYIQNTNFKHRPLIFNSKKINNHPFQAVEGVAGVNSKMNY